jgi:hypothetical protein
MGVRAVPRLCIYTLAFALQLRKITENLSHGIRNALGFTGPNAIRFVDLAIADDGLDWPLPPLAFTSGDGVNPRSRKMPALPEYDLYSECMLANAN